MLYRPNSNGLEVLLIHPSGNYNRNAPWGIPKGEPDPDETDREVTARRETWEETGVTVEKLFSLGFINYRKSRKRVHCYGGELPGDADPHPASWEIDQVAFFNIEEARRVIHPDQAAFLDRLLEHLHGPNE